MDYAGLIQRFKVNRPLMDEERAMRLRQQERLQVEPSDQLATIKINSTYLETVDRYYDNKGWLTLWMVTAMTSAVVFFGMTAWAGWDSYSSSMVSMEEFLGVSAFATAMFGSVFFAAAWAFKKEALGYTHWPIRLNRKTRTVHVFRQNGTVLSIPWDEAFFAIGRGMRPYGVQIWDARGHVLAEDGSTVLETFAFADTSTETQIITCHWEFLRRYMEDGPQAAYEKIKYCMPVDGRRETFRDSHWRLMEEEWFLPLRYLGYPLIILAVCARWLAMRLGKVPQWPAEIEESCRIDPDDPYVKDARDNPPELRIVQHSQTPA